MAAVSGSPPPERWSSCSINQLRSALTRRSNNLGRCLANEPTTTVGRSLCGNGIREGNEICDCGSVEVSVNCYYNIIQILCGCLRRGVVIRVVMPEHADWLLVPSADGESVVLVHAKFWGLAELAGALVDGVTSQNAVLDSQQIVLQISIFKMGHLVTAAGATASRGSVEHITASVKPTLELVSHNPS